MKKWIVMLLCLVLLMGMAGCVSSGMENPGTNGQAGNADGSGTFRVGFGRVNITPEEPTPLQGYGNPEQRLHTEVLSWLYMTCVAVTDANDTTFLFYHIDIINGSGAVYDPIRDLVADAVGIPAENMSFTSTHTHSAPNADAISSILEWAAVKGAKEAMEDRKPATMYIGSTNTVGLNFVRHYFKDNGGVKADNHESGPDGTIVRHTTEVDSQMQLIQFKREGAKDVIMVNWQSHPHITGGSDKTVMSSDIIGSFRDELEGSEDCLFAYYQGAAGNINPNSRIADENTNTTSPKDYRVHGQYLAMHAREALNNMTQVEPGLIKVLTRSVTVETNQSEKEKSAAAADVQAYYRSGHTAAETSKYARTNYPDVIFSIFHANAILSRASYAPTREVSTMVVSLGPVGLAFGPYEMFDTNGMYIKDNSPFQMTFVMGYSNDSIGYIPSAYAFEYGTYEADTTKVAPGTGELLADSFLEMLNEVYK